MTVGKKAFGSVIGFGMGSWLARPTGQHFSPSFPWMCAACTSLTVFTVGVVAPEAQAQNSLASIVVTPEARTVAENGGTATYTVELGTRPNGDVTMTVSSEDPEIVKVSTAAATTMTTQTETESSLTFTFTNGDHSRDPNAWNNPRVITVTGQNDDIDNALRREANISHMTMGGGYDGSTASVTVRLTDDDSQGATLTGTNPPKPLDKEVGFEVTESASNTPQQVTYNVVLDSEPTANVTVDIGTFTVEIWMGWLGCRPRR